MFSNKLRHSGNARNIFPTTIRALPFLHIQENNACHSHSPKALFPPRRMRRVTHSLIKKEKRLSAAFPLHTPAATYA